MTLDANTFDIPDTTAHNPFPKEKVVIIIPTYNEAAVIETTLYQVFATTDSLLDYEIHVLIFDSASTDNTQHIVLSLQKYYPKLHLVTESAKSGLGSAYLQAMNYALTALNADIIFEFDADLSHQPKYIGPMLGQLKNSDCVIGSRYITGGSIPKNWAFHRKLFSILGNYVARGILTPKYKDFTSGFRATRRQQLINILPKQFLSKHYAYKLQLLWLLHKNKAHIREHPIEFIDRNLGDSKLPQNSIADSLRVVVTLRYHELKRYLKMCLVGTMGMAIQFGVYNLLRYYAHMSPLSASQLAVFAAIINNFILNNKITFRVRYPVSRALKIQRLAFFTIYSISMIYLQSYWLRLGILCFGSGLLQENIIIGVGIGIMSFLNYFTYSRHIWREKLALNN